MKKMCATCWIATISKTENIFLNFWCIFASCTKFCQFWRKDRLYSLNISEVIHSDKYGYLNGHKLLFQNILRGSTSSRVLDTADTTMAALISELSFDPRHIECENISFSEISNDRTAWEHVEFRSHVFSASDDKNLCMVFHWYYLKNRKYFLEFLSHFRRLQKIQCMFKKKISFIA